MMKRVIHKKYLAAYLIVLIPFFLRLYSLAEENILQKELPKSEKKGVSFALEVKDDKNLMEGIKSLNNAKYEKAVHFFEKFFFSGRSIFDQIIGVNALSFGGFASMAERGIEYFKTKIKKNPNNLRYFYSIGILRIVSLKLDDNASTYIKKIASSKLDSPRVRYVLGLAYLLEGEEKLYISEYNFLIKQDIGLANRLRSVLAESSVFRQSFEELKKTKAYQR